jgi:hypothetical protein
MRALLPIAALLLASCGEGSSGRSLKENAGLAFAPCNAAEIRFLAGKHNLSPAFDYCGGNTFGDFSWSPDGERLYFSLPLTHHVMHAAHEQKPVITIPTLLPTGTAGWVTATRIAMPLPPANPGEPTRIAVFDVEQRNLIERPLPGLLDPSELVRGDAPNEVLFTAAREGSKERHVYRLDLDDGAVKPAFDWLTWAVDTFTWAPGPRLLAVGVGETVTAYAADGTKIDAWTPALRGSVDPTGGWVMLEHSGDPISNFNQRTWDEVSEGARAREIERTKAYEATLPDTYQRTTRPPTLSLAQITTGARWGIDAFYGDSFQWYEAAHTYGSFILWGFESKQLNSNVLLGTMVDRMASIERGEKMMGIYPMEGAIGAPKANEAPEAAPDAPEPAPAP